MSPVSPEDEKPKDQIARRALPRALLTSLKHIFSNVGRDLWLVGGSALSGFYAGHRRSDDLDLFACTPAAFKAAVLSVHALQQQGARLSSESRSPIYYRADVTFLKHAFTIDIVLDEHLPLAGRAWTTKDGIVVASLDTIRKMKIAALVSRCSEKGLFDLEWLFSAYGYPGAGALLELGRAFDGGVTAETLLFSLKSAFLRKEACHFLPPRSAIDADEAFKKITRLQKKLIASVLEYERNLPSSEEIKKLAAAVRRQRKYVK